MFFCSMLKVFSEFKFLVNCFDKELLLSVIASVNLSFKGITELAKFLKLLFEILLAFNPSCLF